MDAQIRKLSRLKRSGEFRLVREAGVSFAGKWLVFGVWKVVPRLSKAREVATGVNPDGATERAASDAPSSAPPRFGVVTSKKVGGAVVRNRVRRRIRHVQQSHLAQIRNGFWCVTVARFRAAEATFAELDAEWCKLARRAGIL